MSGSATVDWSGLKNHDDHEAPGYMSFDWFEQNKKIPIVKCDQNFNIRDL